MNRPYDQGRDDAYEEERGLIGLTRAEWEQYEMACTRRGTYPLINIHNMVREYSELHAPQVQS